MTRYEYNSIKLIKGLYYKIVNKYNDYYLISYNDYEVFILNKYDILKNINDEYDEDNKRNIDKILRLRNNNNVDKPLLNN